MDQGKESRPRIMSGCHIVRVIVSIFVRTFSMHVSPNPRWCNGWTRHRNPDTLVLALSIRLLGSSHPFSPGALHVLSERGCMTSSFKPVYVFSDFLIHVELVLTK